MEVVFDSVVKRYGDFHAVKRLDLKIKSGALHFLLGPSGCGKTTTLRMLAGLETPSEGRILIGDRDVTKSPAADRGIGMVFQNYALWPHMTVKKNIEYGLKLRKLPALEVKRRLDEVLDITQLGAFTNRLPGQLSGGQQQRVALARALAIRPHVLLLDEPLSNLDAKLRMEMRDNISRIHRQTGITTVYVTHDQKEALSMGTSISVMHSGHLIQTDSPRGLYLKPRTPFIASFIGETNLIPGSYKGQTGDSHLIATELGEITANRILMPEKPTPGAAVVLSIRPETFMFNDEQVSKAANRLTLSVERLTYLGELEQVVFTGPQGVSLKANLFNVRDQDFDEGSQMQCGISSDDVLVLPPQADLGPGT